jgi:hypothetical protein
VLLRASTVLRLFSGDLSLAKMPRMAPFASKAAADWTATADSACFLCCSGIFSRANFFRPGLFFFGIPGGW